MGLLARAVTSRRSKWIFLVAWIGLVVGLGPFAGRFEEAQKDEPSSFLPGSSESVAVLQQEDAFPGPDATPAIAVFRGAGTLDGEGRAAIERVRADLAGASIEGLGEPGPAVLSRDGRAAIVSVPIVAEGSEETLVNAVDAIREAIDMHVPASIEAKVTGPAGFSADANEVFEGINSTLLFSTAILVFVLLVLIYRSPIFWILPLLAVLFAEAVVRAVGYGLASAGVVINGQVGGILLVLVFGAGTNYALLLTARYREELRRHEDKHEAMRIAVRQAGPAIVASAGTVVAALLCLSVAEVSTTAGLGPVGAMGVAVAAIAMLTLLPVLLLVGGRRAFWPFVPRLGSEDAARRGGWHRLGGWLQGRARAAWIVTAVVLGALALGALTLDQDLTTANGFRGSVEAVQGQELVATSFPAGASAPTIVVVGDPARTDAAIAAARSSPLVAEVGEPVTGPPGVKFEVTLKDPPYSRAAFDAIPQLRAELRAAAGATVLVGGPTAEEADLRVATEHDTRIVVPLVLLVVLAILVVLLRSLAAPLMLMATVVLSFVAAVGASLLLFDAFADFPGEDPGFALYAFIFLVALGVDYNIFLMARVREEAQALPTAEAMRRGLAVTGGVITSAGVVLAGTFLVLAVLPLVALTQLGVTVALGVLLDAVVVRSILVPALTYELGERTWWPWPGRLRRSAAAGEPEPVTRAGLEG
ncbi:MAG: MMPL family transporter [Actinobacteria bacterium]|nr:MMPL family transporter [Actinomycetota bacterium]